MTEERHGADDHDLLIRLNTRFETFEKMTTQMWDSINGKMGQVLMEVTSKADKSDFNYLKQQHELAITRIGQLEEINRTQNAKKQMVINIGEIGIRGWAFISGAILLGIAVYNATHKG